MESINTRIIELSIKKRMKRMNLTALLLSGVCCYAIPSKHSRALMPAMVVLIKWATRSVLANHCLRVIFM